MCYLAVQELRKPTSEQLVNLNAQLANSTPQEVIQWAADKYGDDLTLACSFGGISGMALLDMSVKIKPDIEIFYINTHFLFPETLKTRDVAMAKYYIRPVEYQPGITPQQQAEQFGDELWKRNPDLCCSMRKVETNKQALAGKAAWITGLRRDQASTRRDVQPVGWDEKFGLYKISPLAHWDEKRVWQYIFENDVPYNPLHDQGYPSIGCTNCTRRVGEGEESRSGRWGESEKIECGLHR